MALNYDEKSGSPEIMDSVDKPSAKRSWWMAYTDNEGLALGLARQIAPATYVGLPLQSRKLVHTGGGVWDLEAEYGRSERTDRETEEQETSFTFDTSGATQHITQSKRTVGAYALETKTPPDFKGAINVKGEDVEGVDITVPQFAFQETHYFPRLFVGREYQLTLFRLTGTVNRDPFRGLDSGEVLFLGASGSGRGRENVEITFRFSASPNVRELNVGEIDFSVNKVMGGQPELVDESVGSPIIKYGWEYLWVSYQTKTDQNKMVKQPSSAYIEGIYDAADWSGLGIG